MSGKKRKIRYRLTDREIQKIFDKNVKPLVFRHSKPAHGKPVTVLVGAQPAAGKTQGQKNALTLYRQQLTPIVGDDFRKYHPQYRYLIFNDPTKMPDATKQMEAALVEKCIEYANTHGYSTVIEGTWRSEDVVLGTAQAAKEQGRDVHLVALATKPALSRIGMFSRYYDAVSINKPARWTPISAHETVLSNIDGNIEKFAKSDIFDRYTVLDRTGDVLYDGNDGQAWHDTWYREFSVPLTAQEKLFVDKKSRKYEELAKEYTPERVHEVEMVLNEAKNGTTEPLVYVEPYMRKGKLVVGHFRHAPTRKH